MLTRKQNNSGFSLLEILISLVVLSIGVMGLGGLQIAALKGSNESHFRNEASLLMMDLADRMRANLDAVGAGQYESANAAICGTPPAKLCHQTACSSAEMATYDLYSMACRARNSLPQGTVTISCTNNDCATANEIKKDHTIRIAWKEAKQRGEDMGASGDNTVNDRQVQLTIVP